MEALFWIIFAIIAVSGCLYLTLRESYISLTGIGILSVILFVVAGFDKCSSYSTEYLTHPVESVTFHEAYRELITKTCSRQENGKTVHYTCTECVYRYPEWEIGFHKGESKSVPEHSFKAVMNEWKWPKPSSVKKAWFRSCGWGNDNEDGDIFRWVWNQKNETLVPTFSSRKYKNMIKYDKNSVFNRNSNDNGSVNDSDNGDSEITSIEYPSIIGNHYQVTAIGASPNVDKYAGKMAARVGPKKHCRPFFIKVDSKRFAHNQINKWLGGNDNEFLVFIIAPKGVIQDVLVTSWTDNKVPVYNVRDFIMSHSGKFLNDSLWKAIIDFTESEIMLGYQWKDFHTFDYIKYEPSLTMVILLILIGIVVFVGIIYEPRYFNN